MGPRSYGDGGNRLGKWALDSTVSVHHKGFDVVIIEPTTLDSC